MPIPQPTPNPANGTTPSNPQHKRSRYERRLTLQLVLAVAMAIFGCLLIVAAFVVPPTGEIHPSVLTAFGEILTFAGAVLGIDYNYRYKSTRRNKDDHAND